MYVHNCTYTVVWYFSVVILKSTHFIGMAFSIPYQNPHHHDQVAAGSAIVLRLWLISYFHQRECWSFLLITVTTPLGLGPALCSSCMRSTRLYSLENCAVPVGLVHVEYLVHDAARVSRSRGNSTSIVIDYRFTSPFPWPTQMDRSPTNEGFAHWTDQMDHSLDHLDRTPAGMRCCAWSV